MSELEEALFSVGRLIREELGPKGMTLIDAVDPLEAKLQRAIVRDKVKLLEELDREFELAIPAWGAPDNEYRAALREKILELERQL